MFEGLLQPTHLTLILIIVLIVFGRGKLPEIGSAVGKGIREFRKSTDGIHEFTSSTGGVPRGADSQQSVNAAAVSVACPRYFAPNPRSSKFCSDCGAALNSPDSA